MTRASILLIEDDPGSGQAIKELLEFLDYDVEWHRCAEAVSDEFHERARRPDLIVLDLGLGRTDGLALVRRLRAERGVMPPVVVFSARPQAEIARAVADIGAVGSLRKPGGIVDLSRMVERALEAKANRSPPQPP